MNERFTMTDMVHMNRSIDHYKHDLLGSISQPNRENIALIAWNEARKGISKNWWWDTGYSLWERFDVHMIEETWGSTSAGWGGMGGAAMTNTHTVIIHCMYLNIIAVYYGGEIAYVKDITEEPLNLGKIPAFSSVKDSKDILYLSPKYNFKSKR